MKGKDNQVLPAGLSKRLSAALWKIRIGAYAEADAILDELREYLPTEPVELAPMPEQAEYDRFRLATLIAEVAEYKGNYYAADIALRPYDRIVKELQELDRAKDDLPRFRDRKDPRWLLFRQKLYYLWQKSVWHYRDDAIARSRELLDLAIRLAGKLSPPSEALLTQLYYGAGKLAFHECREGRATEMYRQSLMHASNSAREAEKAEATATESGTIPRDVKIQAARYSVAKTLALGLGQCLREQGRLGEAHTQVVAGLFLLNLAKDKELSYYANLLLASIERSMAGQELQDRLDVASAKVSDCALHFGRHKGEVGYRLRLELALIKMQQNRLTEAREELSSMLNPTPDAKWVAECNLGLSRVARRQELYVEAVEFARKSVKAAEGLERIRRRAQVVLVLALYEAAIHSPQDRDDLLRETLKEIERALLSESEPDVRTRANMLLTKTRVLNSKGDIASALDVYKEYEAIHPLIEVGRIKELARLVEEELQPRMTNFRCPADSDPPNFDLDHNIDALRQYVIQKVIRTFPTKTEQANALKRNRTTLYTDVNKPKSKRD